MLGTDIKLSDVDTKLDSIIQKILSYDTIDASTSTLNLKSTISYVDTWCQALNHKVQYYATILGSDVRLLTKSDKLTNYSKTDIDVFFIYFTSWNI